MSCTSVSASIEMMPRGAASTKREQASRMGAPELSPRSPAVPARGTESGWLRCSILTRFPAAKSLVLRWCGLAKSCVLLFACSYWTKLYNAFPVHDNVRPYVCVKRRDDAQAPKTQHHTPACASRLPPGHKPRTN